MANEWELEPDLKEFTHGKYKCSIIRNTDMGHLCGYIKVPKDNIFYNKKDILWKLDCHGGITFSHMAQDQDGKTFVIGFDCAHAWDLIPYNTFNFGSRYYNESVYRNIEFVEKELIDLCEQLDDAENILKEEI